MTQLEYVLGIFDHKLAAWKGKRILLHGTWIYAQEILARFDAEYHFLGVMIEKADFSRFHDKPVYSEEELAPLAPDVIVLTEPVDESEAVYGRIHDRCAERGIALWDIFGLDWLDMRAQIDKMGALRLDEWLEITAPYDVLSFEEPDCFMERVPIAGGTQLRARPEMRFLSERARARGQSVVFLGRGPDTPEELLGALREQKLIPEGEDAERFFVYRQEESAYWYDIRERFAGRKILHIGFGLTWEGILPRRYGVDTRRMIAGMFLPTELRLMEKALPAPEGLRRELEEALADNEVLSFDIFDTLLVRTVLRPEDVFALTRERAASLGIHVPGFAAERKAAQGDDGADIRTIYRRLAERCGLAPETRDRLMELEFAVERDVLRPRESLCAFFRRAVAAGKRVVLTSDMYWNAAELAGLLTEKGITGWETILVSCEHKKRKQQGLMLELAALRRSGERLVHIGDDLEHDVFPALALGIGAVWVPSALALARSAGYDICLRYARTLSERCLLGLAFARAFADPLAPRQPAALSRPDRIARYAALAAGPMLAGFLTWLVDSARQDRPDLVLFAARDGYVLQRCYDELARRQPDWELPPSRYLYTSRHASFLAVADDLEYAYDVQGMAESGYNAACSFAERMQIYYGLAPGEIAPPREGESFRDYCARHSDAIQAHAEKARRASLRYFESAELRPGMRCFFVDFVAAGSTQSFIGRIAPFRLEGRYVARRSVLRHFPPELESYLPEGTPFLGQYMEMESILTSPEPSLDRYAPDGEPVFAAELRSEEMLEQTRLVHAALWEFLEEYFRLLPDRIGVIRAELPEAMYGAEPDHAFYRENYDDWGKCEFKF